MLRSLYAGISGMNSFQTKLDTIGNNIANADTTGFKAGRVMFQDILSQTMQGASTPGTGLGGTNPVQVGLGTQISAIDTMMTDGSLQTTNRNLDFAIQGNGFFTVQNPDNGQTYYTRAGNFYFDANGSLVNSSGWKVVDSSGNPIALDNPASTKSFSFDSSGMLTIVNADGTTSTKGPIGITVFPNPSGLQKVGGSLFEATNNSGTGAMAGPNDTSTGTGSLVVGSLEMSNVDLTNEFSEMIVAERGFQANARTISTSDNVLQEVVNLIHP